MSVVVRIEMPENCTCCPMCFTADVQGYHWCAALEQEVEEGLSRPKECPIICQLPDGHGRLIDADAMEKDLSYDVELDAKALDDINIVGYARERFQFDKNRKQDCIRYLSGQKTIVPAERSET